MMKIYIKNMVCNRCVFVVEEQLKKIALPPALVSLGEVDFGTQELTPIQIDNIKNKIEVFGFELLGDKASQLIAKTKTLILAYVKQHLDNTDKLKISEYLKNKLNYDYNYLSNLFSSIAGFTIEHYLIQLKIEKVKELLFYNELTLSEISFQMDYSSVAHLSSQFKKVTGMTPSQFKKIKNANNRFSLDKL